MTSTVRPGRYDPDNPYAALESLPARHAALMGATSGIKPARKRNFPLETLMLVAGGILLPVGIVAIIVGWYGAAHTPKLYEQNDYLISGGLLGLGLVFMGGFLYFGYWMTRQVRSSASETQQTLRALGRIEAQLSAVMAASPAAGRGAGVNGNGGNGSGEAHEPDEPVVSSESGETAEVAVAAGRRGRGASRSRGGGRTGGSVAGGLVATERGTLIHRPDCPVVANKDNLRAVATDEPGFRACQICSPLD